MLCKCHYCKKKVDKPTGAVNRAKKEGLHIYCNKKCSGLGRRSKLSDKQKKRLKAKYDIEYRRKNKNLIKKKKRLYEISPAGRAMQKRNREKFKQFHLEYCRSAKYRKWKREYDIKHRANKLYGEFSECFLLIKEIEKEYDQREVRQINNLHNKSQNRKRKWKTQEASRNYLQRI